MLLRKEPDTRHKHGAFDCLIETADDLLLDELMEMGLGSLAYCLDDDKLYVKASNGWREKGAGDHEST